MKKLVVNCETGETETVDLTTAEVEDHQAVAAEVEATPEPVDRLGALEAEVRGMKERAAAAQVTGDAAKVRDAVRGPT